MAYPDLAGAVAWSTCNPDGGGVGVPGPPDAGHTLYLNSGCTLTLDGADASTYTCVAIKAATSAAPGNYNQTATIALANATSTIAANLYAGGSVLITLTSAANKTLTLTSITGGGVASKYGVEIASGTHTFNATTCTGSVANGVYISGGTTTATIANAIGGTSTLVYGVRINVNGTYNITNAIGGSGALTHGVYNYAGTGATITNATGGSGDGAAGAEVRAGTVTVSVAKGGPVETAPGALCSTTGTLIVNGTDLTGKGYPVGYAGGSLRLAAGVKLQFANAAGTLTKYYDPTVMPAVTGVISTVSYGGGDYTGTYVAPVAAGYSDLAAGFGAGGGTAGTLAASKIRDATYGTLADSSVLVAAGGTFDEAARNTDPTVAKVLTGTAYKIQNVDKTGTMPVQNLTFANTVITRQ